MILVVWEFEVRPGAAAAFERIYGPQGDWARLFARHRGFRGTELVRDEARPGRYLTLDLWASVQDRAAMLAAEWAAYQALDLSCADLTASERELGVFTTALSGETAVGVCPPRT